MNNFKKWFLKIFFFITNFKNIFQIEYERLVGTLFITLNFSKTICIQNLSNPINYWGVKSVVKLASDIVSFKISKFLYILYFEWKFRFQIQLCIKFIIMYSKNFFKSSWTFEKLCLSYLSFNRDHCDSSRFNWEISSRFLLILDWSVILSNFSIYL